MQPRFHAIDPTRKRFVALLQNLYTYACCHPYGWLMPLHSHAEAIMNTQPTKCESTMAQKTHRTLRISISDATGAHDGGTTLVHTSRSCENCCHDGRQNAEWQRDGGISKFGRCMNLCGAADADDPADRWCDNHQTMREWGADLHCADRPVLGVVPGGVL